MPQAPSEKTILDIRNALGSSYDPEEDAKVIKEVGTAMKVLTGISAAVAAAPVALHLAGKTPLVEPVQWIFYGLPVIPQILFLMVIYMVHATAPKQMRAIARVDRAAFDVYDHARRTGDCSRATIHRLISHYALPNHIMKGLEQKAARIEYILQDSLAAALA